MNPELTALVDLGSNSVRFMLVRIIPGAGYRVLLDTRARTRLGSGPDGTLPVDAIRETVDAVTRFLGVRRREPPSRILAIATSAVRDAPNAEELLHLLRIGAGLEVTVLKVEEEARLGALAAPRHCSSGTPSSSIWRLQPAAFSDPGGRTGRPG